MAYHNFILMTYHGFELMADKDIVSMKYHDTTEIT